MSTNVKPRPTKATKAATPTATTETGAAIAGTTVIESAKVPDRKFVDSYISRKIINGMTDQDIFAFADENNDNVLIYGPTGPGKTSAALAYAAAKGKRFCAIPSNADINPAQLFGKFVPTSDKTIEWVDGPVTDVVRYGGVLLWNEINFTPDRIGTVLFSLLDKRREITLLDHKGEVIQAHPDLLIIADMNPDYEGTRPLNKALRNRFAVQLNWDYDPAVEGKLLKSPALLKMAQQLRQDMQRQGLETPVSTNMLMEFERFADKSFDLAVMMFVNHFNDEERAVVSQIVDTHYTGLKNELSAEEKRKREAKAAAQKKAEDKRRKELEGVIDPLRHQRIDWAVHPKDPNQAKFLTIIDEGPKTKRGDDDDEPWGIYGVTWNWGDENDVPFDVIHTALTDDDGNLL